MKEHHTRMGEQLSGSLRKFTLKTPDVTTQRKGETEEVNSPSCFLGVSAVYFSKAAGNGDTSIAGEVSPCERDVRVFWAEEALDFLFKGNLVCLISFFSCMRKMQRGGTCVQMCFEDLGVWCFRPQRQTRWRWQQITHFCDVQFKCRPLTLPLTAFICWEETHPLHICEGEPKICTDILTKSGSNDLSEAFKPDESFANLLLCLSELLQFDFSAFFSPFCFGFLLISTYLVFVFFHQNHPSFLQITEALQFLNSHHTVTPRESQTAQELCSSHPEGQGYTSHIFLSPRNTCKCSPELCCAVPFLPGLNSSSSPACYFTLWPRLGILWAAKKVCNFPLGCFFKLTCICLRLRTVKPYKRFKFCSFWTSQTPKVLKRHGGWVTSRRR